LVEQAAKQGAQLVVLPEMAVVDRDTADTAKVFGAMAKEHHITLVVGLLVDAPGRLVNCALAFGPDGALLATHTKTHAIPFMEHYTELGRADAPTVARGNDLAAGILICQDDNFTDSANACAKAGAQVLAVPTLDWPGVETAHFTNSRHRALETGLPLVRAAHGGISAIFDADGTLLARRDHAKEGDGIIVANPHRGGLSVTPYADRPYPDLPVLILASLTVGLGLWTMRRKPPAGAEGGANPAGMV
jgi:predicted amidohydrolase